MNQWLTILTSFGVGSVLVVLAQGLFGRRKLSAEATKIITDAASGVVEIQKAELARVLASNTVLSGQVEAQRIQLDDIKRTVNEQIEQTQLLREQNAVHVFWDRQAVEMCRDQGIDLPPPPPLNTGS